LGALGIIPPRRGRRGAGPPAGRWYSGVYDNRWKYLCYRGPDHVLQAFYDSPVVLRAGCIIDCDGPFRYGPGRTDNPCDRHHFWSVHPSGANFAFADTSVRFLSYSAERVLVPLATCSGGEAVSADDF
jgi:prepilin-type processing-associated H-X9-DG protein